MHLFTQRSKLKRAVRLMISLAVWAWDELDARVRRLWGSSGRVRCVVLYYHSVMHHQRARFAKQMEEVLQFSTTLPAQYSGPLHPGRRHTVITFDDAFVSVLDNAIPELERRGIPCAVFVPTGLLGQHPSWIRYAPEIVRSDRVVSEAELRKMAASPTVTLGSHTVRHVNLLKLTREEAIAEVQDSKIHLEKATGYEVNLLSFPHGAHNPEILTVASALGYRRVFTSEPGHALETPDVFVVGRTSASPDDWVLEFRLKVLGAYRWLGHIDAAKAKLRIPRRI